MKLLTRSQMQRLQLQHRFGFELDKQEVVAKLYDPFGPATWYLLNQNPDDLNSLRAIVRGGQVEMKDVSMTELEAYQSHFHGFPLDNDPYFVSMPAKEAWGRLRQGEQF